MHEMSVMKKILLSGLLFVSATSSLAVPTTDSYAIQQVQAVMRDLEIPGAAVVAIVPSLKIGVFIFMNSRDASQGEVMIRLGMDLLNVARDQTHTTHWVAAAASYRQQRAEQAQLAQQFVRERKPNTSAQLRSSDYAGIYFHPILGQWQVTADAHGELTLTYNNARAPYFATLQHWHFESYRPHWNETNPDYYPAEIVTFNLSGRGLERTTGI
jgi:hypothetical protein